MPLITKTLRMNGQAVQTPQQFHECFSPGDFLRNKELAAYFAIRQMEQVSPAHTYFSEMLNIAVAKEALHCSQCQLPPSQCIRSISYMPAEGGILSEACPLLTVELNRAKVSSILLSGHWDYDKATGAGGWDADKNKALMASLKQDPFMRKVQQQVDHIVLKTHLPEKQKGQLALILSMGYLLAGWLPEDRPISPAEAEAAFLGREWTPEVTFRDTPEGRIYPARPEPYKLSPRKNIALAPGETITLRKLIAAPSAQGNTAMPVVFQLPDRQEKIMPGDYRYASFVGEEMIRLYPTEKRNGDRILCREGNTLSLKDGSGNTLRKIPCEEQNIVDMVPAPQKEEYILLTPGHVDYRKFHDKNLPARRIVELQMKGNIVYLLTELGEVRRHGDKTGTAPRATMDGMAL